ncbi:MAG: LysR family transcriptional regulator, partial [Pseudomonadota bacterium]
MGASLFFRSTRSLSLTPEGEAILPAARAMVASAQDALDVLAETNEQLVGALRVTLPALGDRNPLNRA